MREWRSEAEVISRGQDGLNPRLNQWAYELFEAKIYKMKKYGKMPSLP